MARKPTQHVVPLNRGLAIRKSESPRVASTFKPQAEAIAKAREIAQNQQTELFIHGENRQIQERNSYGNDPFPP